MTDQTSTNPLAEMAWAGYLAFLHQEDLLPAEDAIWAMKADFLSGFDDD